MSDECEYAESIPAPKCPAATELAEERAAHLATRQELSMALAQRHVLVEAAVRATIEAAVEFIKADRDQNERTMSDSCWNGMTSAMELVTELKPAPIVARVLGGEP